MAARKAAASAPAAKKKRPNGQKRGHNSGQNRGQKGGASPTGSPRSPGRPLELTPEVTDKICQAIRAGAYAAQAAVSAGIAESTFYRWKALGDAEIPERETKDAAEAARPFREFSEALKKAEADAEVFAAGVIRSAMRPQVLHSPYCDTWARAHEGQRACSRVDANGEPVDAGCKVQAGSWQAAMTYLERRNPGRWRRRDAVEHSGEGGGPLKTENDLGPATRELVTRGLEEIRQRAEKRR